MNPCNNKPRYGDYRLPRSGPEVNALLEKIEALGLVTHQKDGLMSSTDKIKLDGFDSIKIQYHTTEYWNHKRGYIPAEGEIIIYSDYSTTLVDGVPTPLPAMKIGSGNAFVQDLAFVTGSENLEVLEHINNTIIHITEFERRKWNEKLNVNDSQEVIGETLVFNRD